MDFRLAPAFISLYVAAWLLAAYGNPAQIGISAGLVALIGVGYCCIVKRLMPVGFPEQLLEFTGHLAGHLAIIATALAVMCGLLAWQHQRSVPLQAAVAYSETVSLTGKVVTDPIPARFGSGYTWGLKVANSGRLIAKSAQVPYRAWIQVNGQLASDSYAQPGDREVGQMAVTDLQVIKQPNWFWRMTNTLRQSIMDVCTPLSPQAAGLIPGMAIGDVTRLPRELRDAFNVSGLAHLVAVSGSHFAIILTAVSWMLSAYRPPRWLRFSSVFLISFWFVALVRPEGAVLRAAAMCAVSLLGMSLGRRAAGVPALCAGGLVLLIVNPWLARSYGFALSCASSAALMLFARPLAAKLTPWLGERLAFIVAVPMVGSAGAAPILVLLMDRVTTTAVFANLAALPAVVPATLLSLAATIVAPFSPTIATMIARVASIFTGYLAGIATFFAGLPGATLPWLPGVPGAVVLALLLGLTGFVISRWQPKGWPAYWRQSGQDLAKRIPRHLKATKQRYQYGVPNRKDRQLLISASLAAGVLLFSISAASATVLMQLRATAVPGDWVAAFCDVGQGDGLVLKSGPHAGVVIDVGPEDSAINRCLIELDIDQIDLLVLSHFHSDHVGGLRGALAGRLVKQVLVPSECDERTGIIQLLNKKEIFAEVASTGQQGQTGNVRWQLLSENLTPDIECSSNIWSSNYETPGLNDHSLVLMLTNEVLDFDVIALGDLELPGQEALLQRLRGRGDNGGWQQQNQPIEIVKVAHHGSAKQSYELARLLNPQVAVFSSGADNTFGHPTDRALDVYARAGAINVRTDQCGTAVFAKRNNNLVLTCLGGD